METLETFPSTLLWEILETFWETLTEVSKVSCVSKTFWKFPEISFVIPKVPSLAYGRNFSMALSPWHLNSCLKRDSVTQEIIFLGLASVTHVLSFFFVFFFNLSETLSIFQGVYR